MIKYSRKSDFHLPILGHGMQDVAAVVSYDVIQAKNRKFVIIVLLKLEFPQIILLLQRGVFFNDFPKEHAGDFITTFCKPWLVSIGSLWLVVVMVQGNCGKVWNPA
jgi:hypothetical protein